MTDLRFGGHYQEIIELKRTIESRIARQLNLPVSNVLLNYGSNSSIIQLLSSFSLHYRVSYRRPLKLLLDLPNYFFTLQQIREWKVRLFSVPRNHLMEFPFKEFVKKIQNAKPDIIWITTPNNPTGKPIANADLLSIIRSTTKNQVIIIDRSCQNIANEISTKYLFNVFPNKTMIVLHSYSKTHNLSGERVGYLSTNSNATALLLSGKRDLNHNIHALKKLTKLLNIKIASFQNKKLIQKSLDLLDSFFINNRFGTYYKSFSNFALIKTPSNFFVDGLVRFLKSKNTFVMNGEELGLSNEFIRIFTGCPVLVERFLSLYKEYYKSRGDEVVTL